VNVTVTIETLNLTVTVDGDLTALEARVSALETKEGQHMKTIQELVAKIEAEHTAIGGLITLVGGLKQQVVDALASAGQLSAETQAAIDAAFATVDADTAAIAAALSANVAVDPAAAPGTGDTGLG
jgi:hypothetical protein